VKALKPFWGEYCFIYLGYDQDGLENDFHCGEILYKQAE
jgi:hypothetical protein